MRKSIQHGLLGLITATALITIPMTASAEQTLATVNGQAITQQAFSLYNERRPQSNDEPRAILEEMVTVEVLYQSAVASGLDKDPKFLAEADMQRRNLLASIAVNSYIMANPISDEQIRSEYDKQMADLPKFEYKARHILLETEEAAKAVIVALDGGADFAELAKEKSTGPSGASGGDLGWFSSERMVKPFGDAVIAAELGKHSAAPVKTDFGWHVILVEDQRDLALPDFDRTADQLREAMTGEMVRDYLQGLRDEATVEFN